MWYGNFLKKTVVKNVEWWSWSVFENFCLIWLPYILLYNDYIYMTIPKQQILEVSYTYRWDEMR